MATLRLSDLFRQQNAIRLCDSEVGSLFVVGLSCLSKQFRRSMCSLHFQIAVLALVKTRLEWVQLIFLAH